MHLNFYFLSSGYCGTRFHYQALRMASNAEVWHQPGHEEISEVVDTIEQSFVENPRTILDYRLSQFPQIRRRIDKRLALPWIYGDTLNWMRGFGKMLFDYIGAERLRLVELVRHPVPTCRSMLAFHRGSTATDFSDIDLAREMAGRWLRQYSLIRYQLHAIDNPEVYKSIKLENNSIEQLCDLYHFLGLHGFDVRAVEELFNNRTRQVRHSHLNDSPVPASKEELQAIWTICQPLAMEYGYAEDDAYYENAPSRPVIDTPSAAPEAEEVRDSATVKLLNFRGLGLIVRRPSGIHYINQAGGPICFWLHAEGAFIQLVAEGKASAGQRLFDHFHQHPQKTFMSGIRQEDADLIDSVLSENGFDFIRVDRSRIGEEWDLFSWQTWKGLSTAPWEAWVPVQVQPTAYSRISGAVSGLEATDAILIWENSN